MLVKQVGKTAVGHTVVPGSLLPQLVLSFILAVLVAQFHNSKWDIGNGTPHCCLMLAIALL
jgi:hypothetical protein